MIRNNPNNDVDLSPVINLLNELKNNYNGHSIFKDHGTLTENNFMIIDDFKTHINNQMNLYSITKDADYTVDAFNTITFNPIGLITSFNSTESVLNSSFGSYTTTTQSIYTSMENRVIENVNNVGIYPWTNKNYDEFIVKYYTNLAIAENIPDLREYSFKSLTQYFEQIMLAHSVNINWNDKLNELDEFCFIDATSTFTVYDESFNIHLNSNNLIKSVKITNSNNPAVGFYDVKASNMSYNNLMPIGVNLLSFENCDIQSFYADGYFNGISSTNIADSPKIQNATFSFSQTTSNLPLSYLNIQNLTLNNINNKFRYCTLGDVDFLGSGYHEFIALSMFDNACFSNFGTITFNAYTSPNASLTVKNGDVVSFNYASCPLNELSVENINSINFSLTWWWNPAKLICNSIKSLTFTNSISNLLDKLPITIKNCSSVKFANVVFNSTNSNDRAFKNCSFDNIDSLSFSNFVFSNCSINDIHNFVLNSGTITNCSFENFILNNFSFTSLDVDGNTIDNLTISNSVKTNYSHLRSNLINKLTISGTTSFNIDIRSNTVKNCFANAQNANVHIGNVDNISAESLKNINIYFTNPKASDVKNYYIKDVQAVDLNFSYTAESEKLTNINLNLSNVEYLDVYNAVSSYNNKLLLSNLTLASDFGMNRNFLTIIGNNQFGRLVMNNNAIPNNSYYISFNDALAESPATCKISNIYIKAINSLLDFGDFTINNVVQIEQKLELNGGNSLSINSINYTVNDTSSGAIGELYFNAIRTLEINTLYKRIYQSINFDNIQSLKINSFIPYDNNTINTIKFYNCSNCSIGSVSGFNSFELDFTNCDNLTIPAVDGVFSLSLDSCVGNLSFNNDFVRNLTVNNFGNGPETVFRKIGTVQNLYVPSSIGTNIYKILNTYQNIYTF